MQLHNTRILILADINSAHTQKWAIALANRQLQVAVFSISEPLVDWFTEHNVTLFQSIPIAKNKIQPNSFSKIRYVKLLPTLKIAIKKFNPQIIHAYYATSYGLLAALSGFHPFIISAWGSDVMDFPNKSFLHKTLLKYNFKKTDLVLATSNAIIDAIKKVSNVKTKKIAFGINLDVFKELKVDSIFNPDTIVIGTIKSLEKIYGIDILIKSFKQIVDKHGDKGLKLLIVGAGSKESEYKNLVKELALQDKVVFTGKVDFIKVPEYHNMIDIFVNVSRNESFGVAVLEASACEKPVIATDIGGLKEVVVNNETGFLIEPENINKVAEAMEKLLLNKNLRDEMGKKGRKFVKEKFEFSSNVDDTISVYEQFIKI